MTKLAQCAKCKKDRRNCGYYKGEDDTDCPYYESTRRDDREEEFAQRVGIGNIFLRVQSQ